MSENNEKTTAKKTTKKKVEEFDLNKKVKVHSIANWDTSFRRTNGIGAVSFSPDATMLVERFEIANQVQNGNVAFVGIDGRGSHATWYIEDKRTREEFGFEEEGRKQLVLTEDDVRELFNIKNFNAFELRVKELIVSRAEKSAILRMVKKLELNDYAKIRFLEDYTGKKMENI